MYKNNQITIISGPCSLESYSQIEKQLEYFPDQAFLRAGIYKMRTSPESFQGLREDGIDLIKKLKSKYNFKLVSEIVSEESLSKLTGIVDVFQIGTRNMYNYDLLKKLNDHHQPVILKRAFSSYIDEWLDAAKYINNSHERVILCERGIRTFEKKFRNTIDINSICYLKAHTNYKVILDPSHGIADPKLIMPVSLAGIAAGADGLLLESHHNPSLSVSDAKQALSLEELAQIIEKVKELAQFFGKKVLQ